MAGPAPSRHRRPNRGNRPDRRRGPPASARCRLRERLSAAAAGQPLPGRRRTDRGRPGAGNDQGGRGRGPVHSRRRAVAILGRRGRAPAVPGCLVRPGGQRDLVRSLVGSAGRTGRVPPGSGPRRSSRSGRSVLRMAGPDTGLRPVRQGTHQTAGRPPAGRGGLRVGHLAPGVRGHHQRRRGD